MRLLSGLIVVALLGCSKEPIVASKAGSGNAATDALMEIRDLLGEGIGMGPERLGTTLHDPAATSRCSETMARLQPQVEKLRASASLLGAVSIDDLSACVSCASGGDQACSRATEALDHGSRP